MLPLNQPILISQKVDFKIGLPQSLFPACNILMVYSHCAGTGTGMVQGPNGQHHEEMLTLVRDINKNQDPLFPIVPVPFPVPIPVPFPCRVNESLQEPCHK